jgi:flagellar biosynthesis/type III secretory pathway chaperone
MVLDIAEMLKVLEEQKNTLEELIDIADELSPALINDDIKAIVMITGRQEEKGRQMALMEQKRRKLLEEYSLKTGLEIDYLDDLFCQISIDEQEKLERLAFEIRKNHQQLQEAQEHNSLLLKQSLVYVNRILAFLHSRNPGIYSKSGKVNRAVRIGNIDKSI